MKIYITLFIVFSFLLFCQASHNSGSVSENSIRPVTTSLALLFELPEENIFDNQNKFQLILNKFEIKQSEYDFESPYGDSNFFNSLFVDDKGQQYFFESPFHWYTYLLNGSEFYELKHKLVTSKQKVLSKRKPLDNLPEHLQVKNLYFTLEKQTYSLDLKPESPSYYEGIDIELDMIKRVRGTKETDTFDDSHYLIFQQLIGQSIIFRRTPF